MLLRKIHRRGGIFAQAPVLAGTHDADDGEIRAARAHGVPDRRLRGPEAIGEALIYHEHACRGAVIGRAELTTFTHANAHRLEVSGTRAGIDDGHPFIRGRHVPGHGDAAVTVGNAERNIGDHGLFAHERIRVQSIGERAVEFVRARACVSLQAGIEIDDQQVFTVEAFVEFGDAAHVEQEQSRADEQHHRKRHLRDDETFGGARARLARGRFAFERRNERRARRLQCRHDAEQHAGQRRNRERKEQHRRAELQIRTEVDADG